MTLIRNKQNPVVLPFSSKAVGAGRDSRLFKHNNCYEVSVMRANFTGQQRVTPASQDATPAGLPLSAVSS